MFLLTLNLDNISFGYQKNINIRTGALICPSFKARLGGFIPVPNTETTASGNAICLPLTIPGLSLDMDAYFCFYFFLFVFFLLIPLLFDFMF